MQDVCEAAGNDLILQQAMPGMASRNLLIACSISSAFGLDFKFPHPPRKDVGPDLHPTHYLAAARTFLMALAALPHRSVYHENLLWNDFSIFPSMLVHSNTYSDVLVCTGMNLYVLVHTCMS